ncbi:MAG: hypothetical protein ACTSVV_15935 [Promethearchaeota archaeon]
MNQNDLIDYIGVDFLNGIDYIIFNFIDLWGFLEDLFKKENIFLSEIEFDDIKKNIIANIDLSLKFFLNNHINIDKDIMEIKRKAIIYGENENAEDIFEDDDLLENYGLYEESYPILIDEIIVLENSIIHIFSHNLTEGLQNCEYGYIFFSFPSIKWDFSSPFKKFLDIFPWEPINRIGFLGILFENLIRLNLSELILNKFNLRKKKINTIINCFKAKILEDNYIENYFNFESRYFNKQFSRMRDFIKDILEKFYNIRNEIVHNGHKLKLLKKRNKIEEIITKFELFLFNCNVFFETLEKPHIKLREN